MKDEIGIGAGIRSIRAAGERRPPGRRWRIGVAIGAVLLLGAGSADARSDTREEDGPGSRRTHAVDGTGRPAPTAIRLAQSEGWEQYFGGRSMSIDSRIGSHFVIDARVNGTPVRFVVDTGASDVILAPHDAKRLNLSLREADYTQRYSTANGVIKGAPVTLREMSVDGRLKVRNVRASVIRSDLRMSLLGMSFLGRLKGYEVKDGELILYW